MAKYTRTAVYAAVDNRNPAVGTHLLIDDWAAECWTYQKTDPVTSLPMVDENGQPVMETVCTSGQEFADRLAQKQALALWYNPGLSGIYFEMSEAMQARRAGLSSEDYAYMKANTSNYYSSIYLQGGPQGALKVADESGHGHKK